MDVLDFLSKLNFSLLTFCQAASTPAFPLEFQCEYIRLRTSWLSTLRLLLLTCNTFRSSPPPAIATAQASSNGQEGTRWAQVVQQVGLSLLFVRLGLWPDYRKYLSPENTMYFL